jgi:membrane-associated phospholipid phosphatase
VYTGRSSPTTPPGTTLSGRPRPELTGSLHGGSLRDGLRRLGAGAGLGVLLLVVGVLAGTGPLTSVDVALDRLVAAARTGVFTLLAKLVTTIAEPNGGAVLTVLVPVVLFLVGRRGTAVRVLAVLLGALGTATVAKHLVSEHRPPHDLWVTPPDSPYSFPSGHTTVACAYVVVALLIVPAGARRGTLLGGIAFAVLVGWSRVYLGVHYPPDVLGGLLSAAAPVVFLTGVAAMPPVRRWLVVLDGHRRRRGA